MTLYDQNSTVLWSAIKDANGTAKFKLSLTQSNYTNTLHLEAVKVNISLSFKIDKSYALSSDTITLISPTPQPIFKDPLLIYLVVASLIFSSIVVATFILERENTNWSFSHHLSILPLGFFLEPARLKVTLSGLQNLTLWLTTALA